MGVTIGMKANKTFEVSRVKPDGTAETIPAEEILRQWAFASNHQPIGFLLEKLSMGETITIKRVGND
jgi:hypothetical protein